MLNNDFKGNQNNYRGGKKDYFAEARKAHKSDNQQNTSDHVPYKMSITSIPFNADNGSKLMRSAELNELIYDVFASTFNDFYGCMVEQNMTDGRPELHLYFKHKNAANMDKSKLTAFEAPNTNKNTAKGNSLNERFQNSVINRNKTAHNKNYIITDAGKDILGSLMVNRGNQPINWNQCLVEMPDNSYGNPQFTSLMVSVKGIDLLKVIALIYGNKIEVKEEDGSTHMDKVIYECSIVRVQSVGNVYQNPQGTVLSLNFILSIQQLNIDKVNKLAQEFGAIPVAGTTPMFRK